MDDSLLTMAKATDPFIIVPLLRMPAERNGADAEAEKTRIYELIDRKKTDEIQSDPTAMALLKEIGPDENILSYAVNFRHLDGTINPDLRLANELNKAIYDRLSINPGQDIYGYDLIVSTTDLDAATYGPAFIDDFKRRLGTAGSPGRTVTVLRSVVMDPWVTETSAGSFIDVLESEFRKAVLAGIEQVRPSQTKGY